MHSQLLSLVWLFCHPKHWNPPGSFVYGISQARIQEWVAIPFSRDLVDPGIEPMSLASPALAGRFFTTEPPGKCFMYLIGYKGLWSHHHLYRWGNWMRRSCVQDNTGLGLVIKRCLPTIHLEMYLQTHTLWIQLGTFLVFYAYSLSKPELVTNSWQNSVDFVMSLSHF